MDQRALEARLDDLESRLSHSQKALDELNEVVLSQETELGQLKEQIEVVSRELLRLTEGLAEQHLGERVSPRTD